MIDPLLPTALPLPTRAHPHEAPPGTPSFLPWALGVPAQGGDGDAHLPQHHLLPEAIVDAPALEARIDFHATDPAATVVSPALPSSSSAFAAGSAVDALGAAAWRGPMPHEPLPAVVEFHLRNPQGERELIAMPWRLMASGRLAQSLGAGGYADPATLLPAAYPGGTIVPAQSAGAQSVVGIRHAVGASLPGDPIETASMSSTAVARAIVADDDAPLPSLPQSPPSPAAAEWLARWMKWIERDGRDPVVLLRDFRIDDDEAGRLVDGLRAFAQEHGIELDRIVVNGREFWRRPSFQPSRE